MDFRTFFNRPVVYRSKQAEVKELGAEAHIAAAEPVSTQGNEGVFVSKEAFFSFSGMTAVITTIWLVVERLLGVANHSLWIGFILSCLAGAFLFAVHETDPNRIKDDERRFVRIAIAAVNTLMLFSAAAGIAR